MKKKNVIEAGRKIIYEYGAGWAFYRGLYSLKLKGLRCLPKTELLYEKRCGYPFRCDIFQVNTDGLEKFLENLPDGKKKEIIKGADNACVGKIRAFSAVDFDYGYPIRWQLNPVTKKECSSKKKWFEIPDFDEGRGDIKFIWEISRFSHFILLARAYILTRNIRYYNAFSDQLSDWLAQNPYPYGANFKCGQECSFRMANAVMAYAVFRAYGKAGSRDEANIKELVYRSYKKILSNFFYAHKCIRNDHTFSELMGMIIGAWCTGDKAGLDYAYRILDKEIQRQFSKDGGYLSFSFNYEREVLQTLEFIYAVSGKTRHKISDLSNDRLKQAVYLLYQCQEEKTGCLPNYGANDGALIFPVSSCGYRDYRPVMNTVSALSAGRRIYGHGCYDEETLWFTGSITQKKSHIAKKPACFGQAGIFVLRDKRNMVFLVANHYKKRPVHMDQLHLDLWAGEKNIFCDSGSYSYTAKDGKSFISAEAHNTVSVDGKPQMDEYGHFLIYNWTRRGNIRMGRDSLSISIYSKNGYLHRRQVSIKGQTVKLEDKISANIGDLYRVRFHTPYSAQYMDTADAVEIYEKENKLCVLKGEGNLYIRNCLISDTYGSKKRGACIEICGKMDSKTEKITTIIYIGEK